MYIKSGKLNGGIPIRGGGGLIVLFSGRRYRWFGEKENFGFTNNYYFNLNINPYVESSQSIFKQLGL